ncbi:MAG: S8 family serine peptidase [Promethearchaeota archaeon]
MHTKTLSSSSYKDNLTMCSGVKVQFLSLIKIIILISFFTVSTYTNSMYGVLSKEKDSTHGYKFLLENKRNLLTSKREILSSIPPLSANISANLEIQSPLIKDKQLNNLIDIEKMRNEQINRLDENANHISDSLEKKIISNSSEDNSIVSIIITTKTDIFKDELVLFEKLGGVVHHKWNDPTDIVYGFSGEIDTSKIKEFSKQVGSNIVLIEENLPTIRNSDVSTHLGMVRTFVWDELNYTGDPNIAVAVLDTGIDDSHIAFSPGYEDQDWSKKIVGWYDATTDGSTTPEDYIGHGSHVAGIVAANELNDSYDDGRIVSTWSYSYEEWGKSGSFFYILWVNRTGVIDINYVWQGEKDAKGTYLELYAPNGTEIVSDRSGKSNMTVNHFVSSENSFGYWKVVLGVSWGMSGGLLDIAGVNKYPYPDPTDNHSRFTGVAPDVKLVGVKIFDKSGYGTSAEVIEAFNWIKNNKEPYHIIVASGSFSFRDTVTSVDSAAAALVNSGVTVVLSAGNYGQGSNSIYSPGQVDGAITVAASDDYDIITSYSSEGPGEVSNTTKPDIAAPGGERIQGGILQVDSNDADSKTFTWSDKFTNDFTNIQGTSMSCPFVSGSLALLIQAMGGYNFWKEGYGSATNPFRIKQLILMTANEIYSDDRGGKDPVEGYGRLNIYAAIEAIENTYEIGTLVNDTLSSEIGKRKVWVENVTLIKGTNYTFEITVPDGADFDLFLYEPDPNQFGEPVIAANSTNFELGVDEKIVYTTEKNGTYYLVVKTSFTNVGSGKFSLSSTSRPQGPILNITSPIDTIYTTSSIPVTLSGNALHYWYYIEHVDSSNITWTINVSRTLLDGTYTLHAYGNDTSEYLTHRSVTFAIDTTGPTVNINSPTAKAYPTSTITVSLSGNADHYWYYIQNIDSSNITWIVNEDRTLVDGSFTIHAYGNDTVGNEQHVSATFTIDTTPPAVNIDSPTPTIYATSTITVTLSGDAVHYWYYIQDIDNAIIIWTASKDRTLNDGTYTLHAYGNDSVGNEQHVSMVFAIDTTPPTITIESPIAKTYATSIISVSLSGDPDQYWYYIMGVDFKNRSWISNEDRTLSDGNYTLHAYGNDTVGNEQHVSVTFTIDTTPPTVNIDSPIAITYITSKITIMLSGDAVNYWYYIQGVDDFNNTWTSNIDRILLDGTYPLHAYGNDTVGNEQHVTLLFLIDTTPPTINIDSPTAIAYTTRSITISFSGDADHYWYYIQNIDVVNKTWMTDEIRVLSDGTYTLHSYGNDSVGNDQHTTVTFTIDTTPPEVFIDSPNAEIYPTSTITVIFSGDADHYWYFIQDVDSSNITWTVKENRTLIDGSFTLHVYGNDTVGNEQHIIAIFTIDTTPPTVNIDSPTTTTYTTSTVFITLSGDATHYWYYIQGIDDTNSSWISKLDRILSDGIYSLHTFGNDSVGNVAHTSVIFTIDTTPPTVNIDSPVSITYSTSSVTVTLSGDANNYWYFIHGLDSYNLTWTTSVDRTLSDNTYILNAYGNDSVGNEQHVAITLTIDTTPPTVNIDLPIPTAYSANTITVIISGDAINYWYIIDTLDSSNNTWTTNVNRTLSDGIYTLYAYGNDSVGNEQYVTVIFTIDTIIPDIFLGTFNNKSILSSRSEIKFNVTDENLDSVLYCWDRTQNSSIIPPYIVKLPEGECNHTLYIFARDYVGHWTIKVITFTIDDTKPEIRLLDYQNMSTLPSGSVITLEINDSHLDTVVYNWDGSLNKTCIIYEMVLPEEDGKHILNVYASDLAGNWDNVQFTFFTEERKETAEISSELLSIQKKSSSEDSNDIRAGLTAEGVAAGIIFGSLFIVISLILILGKMNRQRYL